MLDTSRHWDAIVIGAGPAGSAAAYHLAKCGRSVLLFERRHFPRDKSCGDGLTPVCVRLLHEMGVLPQLPQTLRVDGVRVIMKDAGHRDFHYSAIKGPYNYGLVVPRLALDQTICQAAVQAGAVLQEGLEVTRLSFKGRRTVGVEIKERGGLSKSLRARIVIAADGAMSRFAKQAGLKLAKDEEQLGFALRAYFDQIEGLGNLLEIYLPLTDVTNSYVLPSYGWVFPTGPHSANVGVGLFTRMEKENVHALYDRFVQEVILRDPRFARARCSGRALGAPLRFDFSPEGCAAPGLLLVGDAAGLISPFTGEGISYALQSGKLAADTIDRCLRWSPEAPPIEDDYRTILEHEFAGYFEAGRSSARRYHLLWHVLESSFQCNRPVFNLFRRLVLVPEGVGGTIENEVIEDLSPLLPRAGLRVKEELVRVGILLTSTIRKDWPFLSRLTLGGRSAQSVAFRPALLFLLAKCFGTQDRPHFIEIAAALDLGYLAILAQSGIEEDPSERSNSGDSHWGNKFCILLSDFLLAKCYELSGTVGTEVSQRIAGALTQTCTGHVQQFSRARQLDITASEHIDHIKNKFATLFELPGVLGAEASGATWATDALADYGRNLGLAFALTDDILFMESPEGKIGSALTSDLSRGILSLPIIRALQKGDSENQNLRLLLSVNPIDASAVIQVVQHANVLSGVRAHAGSFVRRAKRALSFLPEGSARTALERLADYATSRTVPQQPPLALPSDPLGSALV